MWLPLLLLLSCAWTLTTASLSPTSGGAGTNKLASKVVEVTRRSENLIKVKIYHAGQVHDFDLVKDHHMFTEDVQVLHSAGEHSWKTLRQFITLPQATTNGEGSNNNWGSCTMDNRNESFTGLFSINNELLRVVPFKSKCGGEARKLYLLSEERVKQVTDLVLDIPGRECAAKPDGEMGALPPNNTCYKDNAQRLLPISFAADLGFVEAVHLDRGRAAPLAEHDKRVNVLYEIESMLGLIRPLLLFQFNIQLQVERVVVGGKNSDFLSQSPNAGEEQNGCKPAVKQGLEAFGQWKRSSLKPSALWILLTNCFSEEDASSAPAAATYLAGSCTTAHNTALVSHDVSAAFRWLTLARIVGHALGAQQSLSHVRPRFALEDGSAVCSKMTGDCDKYLKRVDFPLVSKCGNGVLEPSEECECLRPGVSQCNGCVECKLTTRNVKCSKRGDEFVMRHAMTAAYLPVTDELLAHEDCCNEDRQVLQPATCNGRRDVCSSTGRCEPACSKYQLSSCKFDETGCVQMCLYEGRCKGGELKTQDTPALPVGMVPNGNACKIGGGAQAGVCWNGVCVSDLTNRVEDNALAGAANRVVIEAHEQMDVKHVSTKEEEKPPRCPIFYELVERCPEQSSAEQCEKLRCTWCGGAKGKCVATAKACEFNTEAETLAWFKPCEPKLPA